MFVEKPEKTASAPFRGALRCCPRRKQRKNAQTLPVAPPEHTGSDIFMLFQKQMRPAFRTIDKSRGICYINFII